MAGSLRVVLGLAALGGEVSVALARLLWENLSRQGRLVQSVRRLEASGKIVLHGDGDLDQRILRLTEEGRRLAQGGIDPPSLWARAWDGRWRIVAFDIPESATALRTRLRRRLHEYRFGWLQNSVWICPDPIDEFRARFSEQHTVPDSLTFFEAGPVGGESHDAIVRSAWDFAALAKSYASYLDVLRLRPGRNRGAPAWLGWIETEYRAWRQIIRQDPFLPTQLLPTDYLGREAWSARQEAFADCATVLTRLETPPA